MSGFKPYDASSGGGGGGGGGVFQAESRVVDIISSGQTGDLLTVTAPAGKTIKITSLYTNNSSSQNGISLIVNGNTVMDQKQLHNFSPTNDSVSAFAIGCLGNDTPFYINRNIFENIYCTSFIINKNAGNTTSLISCTYVIGEVK